MFCSARKPFLLTPRDFSVVRYIELRYNIKQKRFHMHWGTFCPRVSPTIIHGLRECGSKSVPCCYFPEDGEGPTVLVHVCSCESGDVEEGGEEEPVSVSTP